MATQGIKIDLSGHSNPYAFVEEVTKRYPDGNVNLLLEGNFMRVDIADHVHTQIKIDIFSFLQQRVRENAELGQICH
ncbi:MAG: hypothetical protein WAV73_00975 [Candidatus Moraniibacteriota bacterium]